MRARRVIHKQSFSCVAILRTSAAHLQLGENEVTREKMQIVQVCTQKVFKMSIICMNTFLDTLSTLVNCSVDNVLSEIGPSIGLLCLTAKLQAC